MSLLGEVTLIHKDFAKSTAWQLVAFDFCVCLVLVVAMKAVPDQYWPEIWTVVKATIATLAAATFSVLGINIKKMNQIKKELKDEA